MLETTIKAIVIFLILGFLYNGYRLWKGNKILDRNILLWEEIDKEIKKKEPNKELISENIYKINENLEEFAEYFNIENT